MMEIYEPDDRAREAQVYLYTKPVERYGGILSAITPSSCDEKDILDSSLQDDLSSCIQHWIFVLRFDNKTLYLDADSVNGVLIPSVTQTTPQNITLMRSLGTINISPRQAVIKAMQNPYSFAKYDLAYQNCQNWFVELYRNLGLNSKKCPVPVKNYITPIKAGLAAASTSRSFGLGFLGSLFSSVSTSAVVASNQDPAPNPLLKSVSL